MELQDVGKRHKLAQIVTNIIKCSTGVPHILSLVTAKVDLFKRTLFRTQRWYLPVCDGIVMSGESVFMVRLMSDALPVWG